MLDEEDFKNKYLQQPITFLTEENLDILETHCRRAVNFEKGFEHKVVLELLERYYQFQKEIQDKNNRITKLQKQNEELNRLLKFSIDYRHKLEEDLYEGASNFIVRKDKIREKIKKLIKKLNEPNNDRWEKDDNIYYQKIKAKIQVLKELLGE